MELRGLAWPAKVVGIGVLVFAAGSYGGTGGALLAAMVAVAGELIAFRKANHDASRIEELRSAVAELIEEPSAFERGRQLDRLDSDLRWRRIMRGR